MLHVKREIACLGLMENCGKFLARIIFRTGKFSEARGCEFQFMFQIGKVFVKRIKKWTAYYSSHKISLRNC